MSNDKSDATRHGQPYDWASDPNSGYAPIGAGDHTRGGSIDMPAKPKKKKRIFMWFFLAVQALFILWLVVGLTTADPAAQCATEVFNEYYTKEDCMLAAEAGTGIGAGLIFVFWLIVNTLLLMVWAVTKLARR